MVWRQKNADYSFILQYSMKNTNLGGSLLMCIHASEDTQKVRLIDTNT